MSSKKKRKKKMTKSKAFLHPKLAFVVSLLAFLSLFSFIGTFAWFTSEDSRVNPFQGGRLAAEIDEIFQPNENWNPGTNANKEVYVTNTGEIDAFVRVSFYEFLLNFEVDVEDQTGNANLKTVKQPKTPEVNSGDTDTWKPAADGKGTFKYKDTYYIAQRAWVPDPTSRRGMYEFDKRRDNSPHKFITLNFSNSIRLAVDQNATTDYWLYSGGYFYYSRPLKPKEKSDVLLKSLSLSDGFPNEYKGSLYKVKVYMDAHDLTEPVFSTWEIKKTDPAYDLLSKQIK